MTDRFRYWFPVACTFAIAFALITPPFQVPDEVGHCWRAYTIARGEIIPSMLNGRPSAAVPLGVRRLVANLWLATAGRSELKVGWPRLHAAVMIPLGRSNPVSVTFPAHYAPVPYAAAALGCWIGDTFDPRVMSAHHRPSPGASRHP